MPHVEIDDKSGFCFGVVTAIKKAEEELGKGETLYCLGDIVHNNNEVERLRKKGLVCIGHEEFARLRNVKVLLRAHGEPPQTYRTAEKNNIEIIDATCPVVLQLQRQIKETYNNIDPETEAIVIYGKLGHAEVNGLVGQTEGNAAVVEREEDFCKIDRNKDIHLYSQTTKSVSGLNEIAAKLRAYLNPGKTVRCHDTICRQVANRIPNIKEFARKHDTILFVCGEKSSNGKVLFEECRNINGSTLQVSGLSAIPVQELKGKKSIGICGATSTPKWLMEEVAAFVKRELE